MTTPNLSLVQPPNNSDVGTWDVPVNANMAAIDAALGGLDTLNAAGASGVIVLALSDYQNANLVITGTPAGPVTYQLPAGVGRFFFVEDQTGGAPLISFSSASGGATATLPKGEAATVVIDPTNGARFADTIPTGAGGAPGQVQFNSGGALTGSPGLTFSAGSGNLTVGGAALIGGGLQVTGNVLSRLNVTGGSAQTASQALTFAPSAMAVNCALSNCFTVTLTANITGAPALTGQLDGQTINIRLQQDGTGSRTIVWPTTFRWPGGVKGVLSTAAGSVDLLVATYFSVSGTWLANLVKGFA